MPVPVHHLRVLEPAEGVLAFYEGRDGHRFAEGSNWVDDGALLLGVASYAVFSGADAVVYDTHVSVERGRYIRSVLEAKGVQRLTEGVVRSAGRVPSTPEGIKAFAESLLRSDRVALEVTGSAWELARILEPHVDRVVVVSPDDTGIVQARAKTDRLDARTLARLLWTGELESVWVPDERCRVLRRRLARRKQLVHARTNLTRSDDVDNSDEDHARAKCGHRGADPNQRQHSGAHLSRSGPSTTRRRPIGHPNSDANSAKTFTRPLIFIRHI
jgi:hypothetical protein